MHLIVQWNKRKIDELNGRPNFVVCFENVGEFASDLFNYLRHRISLQLPNRRNQSSYENRSKNYLIS